jgi:hypothetical protein
MSCARSTVAAPDAPARFPDWPHDVAGMVAVAAMPPSLGSTYPATAAPPGHLTGELRDMHPQPFRHVQAGRFSVSCTRDCSPVTSTAD